MFEGMKLDSMQFYVRGFATLLSVQEIGVLTLLVVLRHETVVAGQGTGLVV
jgi:hypothetical protein